MSLQGVSQLCIELYHLFEGHLKGLARRAKIDAAKRTQEAQDRYCAQLRQVINALRGGMRVFGADDQVAGDRADRKHRRRIGDRREVTLAPDVSAEGLRNAGRPMAEG